MKKGIFFSIILISGCIFLTHCNKVPVYPDTPEISFNIIDKYTAGDSLVITINFKDGDGDLGLEADELYPPYHELDYVKDGMGNYIRPSSPGAPAYNCVDYTIGVFDTNPGNDTVLLTRNKYYNNYIIDVLVKQPDQSFIPFDFNSPPICGANYNGRFPLLSSLDSEGPIEGTLSYTMKDLINFNLSGEYVKFKIYIYDRAFNKSNEIETTEILMD